MRVRWRLVFNSFKGSGKIPIDDRQRHINKLMGISDECFQKYSPSEEISYLEDSDQEQATARVAKLMGISKEDIDKYAFKDRPSDSEHMSDGESLKHIAELMGIGVEDISRYGS